MVDLLGKYDAETQDRREGRFDVAGSTTRKSFFKRQEERKYGERDEEVSSLIGLVMRFSGGRVTDPKIANYILLGIALVSALGTLFVVYTFL